MYYYSAKINNQTCIHVYTYIHFYFRIFFFEFALSEKRFHFRVRSKTDFALAAGRENDVTSGWLVAKSHLHYVCFCVCAFYLAWRVHCWVLSLQRAQRRNIPKEKHSSTLVLLLRFGKRFGFQKSLSLSYASSCLLHCSMSVLYFVFVALKAYIGSLTAGRPCHDRRFLSGPSSCSTACWTATPIGSSIPPIEH